MPTLPLPHRFNFPVRKTQLISGRHEEASCCMAHSNLTLTLPLRKTLEKAQESPTPAALEWKAASPLVPVVLLLCIPQALPQGGQGLHAHVVIHVVLSYPSPGRFECRVLRRHGIDHVHVRPQRIPPRHLIGCRLCDLYQTSTVQLRFISIHGSFLCQHLIYGKVFL